MKYYVTSKISENIQETPEGFLVCIGVPIARTGEMIYGKGETPLTPDDTGRVIIDRNAEEVFRPETMASFEGKPLTITHPNEFVTPDNWKNLAKGVIQNVRRGEGETENDLLADLLITDSVAIKLVKNGLREVSCGYEAEYTQTGDGRGFQSKIVGNHLALVDQGRAGSSYAINDHKGVIMKLSEKIKSIFARAQDEAMKLAETTDADIEKKEAKKDDKKEESNDASGYDELKKMVSDLGEKISAMSKPKDETSPATENEPAKTDAKDDEEGASSLEDRLKALEASVAKLLKRESKEDEVSVDDKEDDSEEMESEDDDMEENMTGDSASRAEILAPGITYSKDVKKKALKAAYETKEGKKIIDSLTGGKPTFDSAEKVDTLFIAVSELLKVSRNSEFAQTKQTRDSGSDSPSTSKGMSAEQMNELNAKHYGQK